MKRLCLLLEAEDGIRDGHVTGVQTCALPISSFMAKEIHEQAGALADTLLGRLVDGTLQLDERDIDESVLRSIDKIVRSEEHTSELQSRGQLVCRLLLEKKIVNIISLNNHRRD